MKKGLLLVNLGTPEQPTKSSVRAFLSEFLIDRHVVDLPLIPRHLLLHGIILPFRTKNTTHAYQKIWTKEGSPLLNHSQNLRHNLQEYLGSNYQVALGMRYGKPSIDSALQELKDCEQITVFPLYPQYAAATTKSSILHTLKIHKENNYQSSLKVIKDFCTNPHYIFAQTEAVKPYIDTHEHILFSYHGLPERQLHKVGCKPVCKNTCVNTVNCYRSQCLQTTDLLAKNLNISSNQYSTSFQSRIGKTPWIKPYTDEVLQTLAERGIKNLAVACPSFVADCLETLEEIAIRAKTQWQQLGGETLTLIPALNSRNNWVHAITNIIKSS